MSPTTAAPRTPSIAAVRTRPLPDPRLQQLLVDVAASDGTTGTGECWWGISRGATEGVAPFAVHDAAVQLLAGRCAGQPTGDIERVTGDLLDWAYRYGDGGVITGAISGIDLALWDLLGKGLGVPVFQLLGGQAHDRLPAYASLPPLHSLDRVVFECERARSAGFRAFKLHESDAEIVLAVRTALGPDAILMIDVNGCFDVPGAIQFAKRIEPADIYWYEEPVRPMRHPDAIAAVAAGQAIPLAGGENEYSLADFDRILRRGLLRWLQPEITKVGGLTVARKIGVLAELHAVALCPHNFRIGPALSASMHWGFASPAPTWMELPWLPDGWTFPCGAPLPDVDDGTVGPPPGPGFGLNV